MVDEETAANSSEIEERAKKVFFQFLPDNWIPNPLTPDKDHLDYRVVILDGFVPTGMDFLVQLKGVLSPTMTRDNALSYPFKRDHVIYWTDRQRRPVFVLVADISSGVVYWESIQHWAKAEQRDWRSNESTVTIPIPLGNTLGDRIRLLTAIHEADSIARERHAVSLAEKVRRIEELDKRFSCEVRFGKGTTTYVLQPQVALAASVQASDSGAAKMRAIVEHGVSQDFDPGELRFGGGGVFDELNRIAAQSKVTLEAKSSIPCEVTLTAEDAASRELAIVYGIRGQLVGGVMERRILAQLHDGLISASGIVRLIPPRGIAMNYNLSIDAGRWVGSSVLNLPHFDRVQALFEAAKSAESMCFNFEVLGETLRAIMPKPTLQALIAGVGPRMSFLGMARKIAMHLGINPELPRVEDLGDDELDRILLLGELIEKGWVELATGSGSISGTAVLDQARIREIPAEWLQEPRFMVRVESPAAMFGTVSGTHVLRHEYRDLTFTQESIEKLKTGSSDASLPVQLCASPETRVAIRLEQAELIAEPTIAPRPREA